MTQIVIKHQELEEGKTFKYNGVTYTVVGSFTDEGELKYILKFFGISQQWQHYEVWSALEYEMKVRRSRELNQLRGHEFGAGRIKNFVKRLNFRKNGLK